MQIKFTLVGPTRASLRKRLSDTWYWFTWHYQDRLDIAIPATAVVLYFVGFWIFYRITEGWTHPADWWFHLDEQSQAAWIGATGTVAAIAWAVTLYRRDIRERHEERMRACLAKALGLIEELRGVLKDLAPLRMPEDVPERFKQQRIEATVNVHAKPVDATKLTQCKLIIESPGLLDLDIVEDAYLLLEVLKRHNDCIKSASNRNPQDVIWSADIVTGRVFKLIDKLKKYLPVLDALPPADPKPKKKRWRYFEAGKDAKT